MLHLQKRSSTFALLWLLVVGGGLFVVSRSVHAGEPSEERKKERQSALASDRTSAVDPRDPTEAVAREILQLQQQLGGSVVRGRAELQGWPAEAPALPPRRRPEKWPRVTRNQMAPTPSRARPPQTKVRELREAAWQLDTTAYRLENLDLYDQADALREVATRLRRDARGMQSIEKGKNASVGRE